MIWKICFAMAILFAVTGTAVYIICRKKGASRIQYLGAGVFLASVTMCFPVMYMQENAGLHWPCAFHTVFGCLWWIPVRMIFLVCLPKMCLVLCCFRIRSWRHIVSAGAGIYIRRGAAYFSEYI